MNMKNVAAISMLLSISVVNTRGTKLKQLIHIKLQEEKPEVLENYSTSMQKLYDTPEYKKAWEVWMQYGECQRSNGHHIQDPHTAGPCLDLWFENRKLWRISDATDEYTEFRKSTRELVHAEEEARDQILADKAKSTDCLN